jgi:hypothetical protein
VWQGCGDILRRAASVALESAQIRMLQAGMRLGRQQMRCAAALVARRGRNLLSIQVSCFVEHGRRLTPLFDIRNAKAPMFSKIFRYVQLLTKRACETARCADGAVSPKWNKSSGARVVPGV